MPRKRRKVVVVDDDQTRFSFDLDQLSDAFTVQTASSSGTVDQLYGRIISSHAAPYGGRVFSERHNVPTEDHIAPVPPHHPSNRTGGDVASADTNDPPDNDWDDFWGSTGDAAGAEEDGENDESWGENATEGFAASFGLDDMEPREEADNQEPDPSVHDAVPVKKVRCRRRRRTL